ncbi:hemagglutinin repeat-containing protein [Kaistia sp. MMO-174]|uniref:hemagglutinin repeat-containing protein n=1 Tax=Kaistia sp. MMO-174 TaxID=3081256 RepID=UPI00301A5547
MKITEIFTPFDTPTVTYVERGEHKFEARLRDAYDIPKMVLSLSGPSKSGKTVLVKKVVPEENIITISGASLSTADDLWIKALRWMDVPSTTAKSTEQASSKSLSGSVNSGVSFLAKAEVTAGGELAKSTGSSEVSTYEYVSMEDVAREIAGSDYVVFIDDFHYIRPELRSDVGRQIKAAAEAGIRIFTASVPHRSDDVVRSNPELRGRVVALDLPYWSEHELSQIAEKGFAELKVSLGDGIYRRLAAEAFGSPQLMQSICLSLCQVLGYRSPLTELMTLNDLPDGAFNDAMLATSSFADFSKLVSALHIGAKTRGTERKIHSFSDATKGDVYRAVLLAITLEPASLSLPYDEILSRVKGICIGDAPVGSSINSSLEQMVAIGEDISPGTNPIAWDGDRLDITDPYFLFYLRNSDKLSLLAR